MFFFLKTNVVIFLALGKIIFLVNFKWVNKTKGNFINQTCSLVEYKKNQCP